MRLEVHCDFDFTLPTSVQRSLICSLLWRGDADLGCSTCLHCRAGFGLQAFVHADLYGCEVVVSAADGKAAGRDGWVALCEKRDELRWRETGLLGWVSEFGGNLDGLLGATSK